MKKIVDIGKWNEFYEEKTHRLSQYAPYEHGFGDAFDLVEGWLEAQPDAEEKRGKWIDLSEGDYKCSSCNEIFTTREDCHPIYDYGLYYCLNCGAKMDLGEEKEEE